MRKLLGILIVGVLFATACPAQNDGSLFLKSAIQKLKNSRDYTLKTAALMPAEKYDYKPSPEEMSFGAQLLHLCTNMGWLCTSFLGTEKNPVTTEDGKLQTKAEIQSVLIKTYAYAINTLEHFDKNKLAEPVTFFAGPMTRLQIINLLSDHQTHHRAQILVYLRLNGIKPPDYVGW